MNKTSKIIFIIGVLCMLVPFMVLGSFASAETVTEDGAEFIFRELHATKTYSPGSSSYYFDTDNGYFTLGYNNISDLSQDLVFVDIPNIVYEFSMNGSPFVSFGGDYAIFTPRNFAGGSVQFSADQDYLFDGRLHSYALIFAVPVGSTLNVQDNFFTFTNVDFQDDSSLTKLNVTVGLEVAGLVPIEISGSSSLSALGDVPRFSYFTQMSVYSEDVPLITALEFYVLTWYHTPTFYNMYFNVTPTSELDLFFMFSLIDMVSVNTGYETGYREGVTAGKQQGYDEGFTAGEQQGYNQGVTDGKYQANNTVNTGSASYIKGYQDGLDAPEYSFMSLISSIIDAPIRAFFGYTENGVTHPGLFNFNIFGYDMSNLVLSIFSLCVLITILRLILGGK